MNPDPDEHAPPSQESLEWGDGIKESNREKKPVSGYSMLTEQARRLFPGESKCRMFCGGKTCKYCTTEFWKPEQMAIDGLYSEWVTDNIMAMARMSNHNIEKYKMFDQMRKQGIKTVINLQEPEEHAFCGFGNDASGFSYNPQVLMEAGFFYYNFALKDYGIATMARLLDMVKVVQFALSEGKVAVHCHAGLGRTGLLIACYLIYNNRVKAGKCIQYVRSRRPRAIQTSQQMNTCHEFQDYLQLFYIIFPNRIPDTPSFSFSHFLSRQRNLLHGYEGRKLKNIPKVIYVCCERLLELCGRGHALSSLRHKEKDPLTEGILAMDETVSFQSTLDEEASYHYLPSINNNRSNNSSHNSSPPSYLSISAAKRNSPTTMLKVSKPDHRIPSPSMSKRNERRRYTNEYDDDSDDQRTLNDYSRHNIDTMSILNTQDDGEVCNALTTFEYPKSVTDIAVKLEVMLNQTDEAWKQLAKIEDPLVLCVVMWDWLDQLNEPILRAQDVTMFIQHSRDLTTALNSLEKSTKHFIQYICCVLSKLYPIDPATQQQVLEVVLCHLTQKRHGNTIYPPSCSLSQLMEEKVDVSINLFEMFLYMIEQERQKQ